METEQRSKIRSKMSRSTRSRRNQSLSHVSEFIPQQQKEDKLIRSGKNKAKLPHTLALVPLVKWQVFCVGISRRGSTIRTGQPRFSCLNRSVLTTKGQMKPTIGCVQRRSGPERTAKEMSPNIRSYPVL